MKNVINWFDIPTLDFDRAVKFYSTILDAEINVNDTMGQKLGFFPMENMEGVGGDIVPPNLDFKPAPGGVRIYLNCEGRLDQVLAKVEEAGGRIINPKTNIGEPGWIAVIMDTEGNSIGLHSMKE